MSSRRKFAVRVGMLLTNVPSEQAGGEQAEESHAVQRRPLGWVVLRVVVRKYTEHRLPKAWSGYLASFQPGRPEEIRNNHRLSSFQKEKPHKIFGASQRVTKRLKAVQFIQK